MAAHREQVDYLKNLLKQPDGCPIQSPRFEEDIATALQDRAHDLEQLLLVSAEKHEQWAEMFVEHGIIHARWQSPPGFMDYLTIGILPNSRGFFDGLDCWPPRARVPGGRSSILTSIVVAEEWPNPHSHFYRGGRGVNRHKNRQKH